MPGDADGQHAVCKKYVRTRSPPWHVQQEDIAQVKALNATFQKYASRYQLDWLLLIAQGYQESQLNQHLKSHAGAVGVMQVKPSTAAGSPINIRNIDKVDNNVHAGVKYMRYLINNYFNDPKIDTLNGQLLALASYNAGPGRVAQLRRMTKATGLNPNLWFDNVEIIAAREIGRETVQYVSNIYKFYASYRAMDYYISQRGKKPIQYEGR
jgi:membrane-bound lytic murein transglycosylase MltF